MGPETKFMERRKNILKVKVKQTYEEEMHKKQRSSKAKNLRFI